MMQQLNQEEEKLKQELRTIFLREGECLHRKEFQEVSFIPGTQIIIIDCGICGKRMDRFRRDPDE